MDCPVCGSPDIVIQEFRVSTVDFDRVLSGKDLVYWCNSCSKE